MARNYAGRLFDIRDIHLSVKELTKILKRKLNEQSMLAHEEELRRALMPLAEEFDQWRQGRVSSGELALIIRDWDFGPQKELFKKYNYGIKEMNVACAIVTGILDERNVDSDLLQALERHIAFCREQLRDPMESKPNPTSAD